jgi:hypothetical protein
MGRFGAYFYAAYFFVGIGAVFLYGAACDEGYIEVALVRRNLYIMRTLYDCWCYSYGDICDEPIAVGVKDGDEVASGVADEDLTVGGGGHFGVGAAALFIGGACGNPGFEPQNLLTRKEIAAVGMRWGHDRLSSGRYLREAIDLP